MKMIEDSCPHAATAFGMLALKAPAVKAKEEVLCNASVYEG